MNDKIDLDAIINSNPLTAILNPVHKGRVKELMKEVAHQVLVLASEKAEILGTYKIALAGNGFTEHTVNKQSILNVEKLIT